MSDNWAIEEQSKRIQFIEDILKKTKEKGQDADLKKLYRIMMTEQHISPILTDKYLKHLERAGSIKIDEKLGLVEYIGD